MKCPVCKGTEMHTAIDVHSNGFDEEIYECDVCATTWSVNHGMVEVIKDSQEQSFLEAKSGPVEGSDHGWAET